MKRPLLKIILATACCLLFVGVIAFFQNQPNDTKQVVKSQSPRATQDENTAEAMQFAKQFLKQLYQIQYQDVPKTLETKNAYYRKTYKPYLTDKVFSNLMANRVFDVLRMGPVSKKLNIEVSSIQLKPYGKHSDAKNMEFSYHTQLVYKDGKGQSKYTIPIKGQLTVIKQNGDWKISRSWSNWRSEIPSELLIRKSN